MLEIKLGDMVIHEQSGVIGKVIKQYFPTSCAQQTMVDTIDGRKFHAPTAEWRHYDFSSMAAPAGASLTVDAAAPIMRKQDIRHIKVDEDTYIDIDLEEMKERIKRDLYKDILPGLHYGA